MTQPQFFTVFDKGRQLDFEGMLLATSTSFVSTKSRWFVVSIYKTTGGKYIVHGIGMSRIVHRENCAQMKEKNAALKPAIRETSMPCTVCRPILTENVAHEINREWAQVSDDPRAIIERLRLRDNEGVWYLPKTSSTAILAAAELDSAIKEAFYEPQRIL
jgi:hypothetical protein